MDLKGPSEFRRPKMKEERIPDKGIIVSQSTEEGKRRLVTGNLRTGEREPER